MITSKLRLPFAVRWGDEVLQAGEYELIFLSLGASPIVAIHGGGVAAMMKPCHVDELSGTFLSTLFLKPNASAPQVQLLRLAVAGLDLYFQKTRTSRARRGVLAVPVQEDVGRVIPETGRPRDC
jgi:hypothetical protein